MTMYLTVSIKLFSLFFFQIKTHLLYSLFEKTSTHQSLVILLHHEVRSSHLKIAVDEKIVRNDDTIFTMTLTFVLSS